MADSDDFTCRALLSQNTNVVGNIFCGCLSVAKSATWEIDPAGGKSEFGEEKVIGAVWRLRTIRSKFRENVRAGPALVSG